MIFVVKGREKFWKIKRGRERKSLGSPAVYHNICEKKDTQCYVVAGLEKIDCNRYSLLFVH